ncbi:MAG: hypothetical protein ACOC8G_00730 [Thermodesulfobacteriota bacterium]
MSGTACPIKKSLALSGLLVWLLVLLLGLAWGCGRIRPVPEAFQPEAYTPVTIAQLQAPRKAGLTSGQKVRVEGFFWQYLDYDPDLVANYATMVSHPVAWSRLRWAALYQQRQMRGYYDRLALTRQQQVDWTLRRLEQVRVYGQLAPLGWGVLYLQAHRLERLEDPVDRKLLPPVAPQESPTL